MTENDIRYNLAVAYQALAKLQMDDLTYTHLSARIPGENAYYIYPFGFLFAEVTPENLIKVSLDGKVLEGEDAQYNKTGYVIHGSIYRNRADINAIFHLHTPEMVAVSSVVGGLKPISQWALHFYNKMAYHDYNSLALSAHAHEHNLVHDLADKYVMLMKHHGAIMAGRTIHEAFYYTHHLQKACKTQCLVSSSGFMVRQISEEICEKSVGDLLSFEPDFGLRDWRAIQRWVGLKRREAV
jgi:ribulose-5-phosphate 4-epimerase/fuculose-1-phosphate aldolase